MPNVLSAKAILATLNISRWTARRYDAEVTSDIHTTKGADHDSGRYNKRLVARENLEKISTIYSRARHLHIRLTHPWNDSGNGGQRLLPSALFLEYSNEMKQLESEFDAAADDFAKNYPAHIRQAKKSLNGLFNAGDYPSPSEIRGKFAFRFDLTPVPDAEDFRISVSQTHLDDMKADMERRLSVALESTNTETVKRILDVVGHMAERLKAYVPASGEGDKAENTFRDSLVTNVRDLARLLPAFNLSGNNQIGDITDRIETQLCGHDAQELRDDAGLREKTADAAEAILNDVRDFMS